MNSEAFLVRTLKVADLLAFSAKAVSLLLARKCLKWVYYVAF